MMFNPQKGESLTCTSQCTLLSMLEHLPDALIGLDDNETIMYVNTHAQTMTGMRQEQLLAHPFWRSIPQVVSPTLYQAVIKVRQTRKPADIEYESPVLSTWLHVQLIPTLEGLILHFHEMSAAPQQREMVAPGQLFKTNTLKGVHAGIVYLTPEGMVLEINGEPFDGAYVQRDELLGRSITDAPWWSCTATAQEQIHTAIIQARKGEAVHIEVLIHPETKMALHLDATIIPILDANQHIESLMLVESARATQNTTETDIHTLIDTIPQLVWIADPDGSVIYNNQRLLDYLALPSQQVEGDGWMVGVHPDDLPRARQVWQTSVQAEMPYEVEYRFRDGETREYHWFLARALPVRDEAGHVIRWFGTCTDIDAQKQIEEALRESQEQASILMNSSIIGINIADGERVIDANDTYLRMTGYTREDLHAGKINWMQMTPPEYRARTQQSRRELAAWSAMTPYEKEYICKDGSRLPVLVGRVALQHHPTQTIGFVLDNSAHKELEQRKDAFISMASHELKTPLTALKMQAQLVRRRLTQQSHHEAATLISRLEGPIKQLERLIGELLDVSKIQAGKLEYVQGEIDLHALLLEVADTMQQIQATHTIRVCGEAPCVLIGDKDRLGQVFINLINNAIKYSSDAETVEVDLSTTTETAIIRVRDHGIGIPQEQQSKIFERFYRASGPRQKAIPGLGMGLYIVAEIIRYHKGTLTVESTVGQGSTFQVTLPRKKES